MKSFAAVPVVSLGSKREKSREEAGVELPPKAGGEPKLTVYPEAGHDSWTETYNNPKFYEWLMEQERSPE